MTNIDLTSGQTGRVTRGRTPIWRFAVNGAELDVTVSEAQILFSKNQHDLVMMTMSSASMLSTEGWVDQPVSFLFGQAPRIEPFYGYIVSAAESSTKPLSPGISAINAPQFTVTIMGTTRVMQGGRPRFWRDQTISGVTQSLVQLSGLGYAGQDHTHKWKSLAQTNDSDWAIVLRLANRLGWDVYTRYGVVMCYDPEVLFKDRGSYTLLKAGNEDDYSTQDQRLVLEFNASDESDETPESIGMRMGYFNGETPQMVTQEGEFRRYKFRTDQVIRSKEEATIYESAYNLADSYDTQKAAVRLYGEADLYPGMGVDVTTSNYRVYKGRFDGRWLIDTVTHKMDRASFQTQARLSRPGKAQIQTSIYRSFWGVEAKAKPTMHISNMASVIPDDPGWIHAMSTDLPSPALKSPYPTFGSAAPSSTWISSWNDVRFGIISGGLQ